MKIAVVIATAGRPGAAQDPIDAVVGAMDRVEEGIVLRGIVSAPEEADVAQLSLPEDWEVILGKRGLAAQRNSALTLLAQDTRYVFFFDDDAIPREDYLSTAIRVFREHPKVVGVTGNVVVDGAPRQCEVAVPKALALLRESFQEVPGDTPSRVVMSHTELYGCNFGIRWSALSALRFDERLPLYSWLEDHDYACRARRYGKLAWIEGCVAAHRGSGSGGRLSHVRFGYSQVANPIYLWQKGSFGFALAMKELFRPALKNLCLSVLPTVQGEIRRRRLMGNVLALRDILRSGGRAHPEGMLRVN